MTTFRLAVSSSLGLGFLVFLGGPARAQEATPVASPSPASAARPYGSRGVLEVGGTLGLSSDSSTVSNNGTSSTTNTGTLTLRPLVGYFIAPGLELIGLANLSSTATTQPGSGGSSGPTSNKASVQLGGGAGYFFPLGNRGARLGPLATLNLVSVAAKTDDGAGTTANATNAGVAVDLGGALKIPFGDHALVTAGIDLLIFGGSISGSATSGGTTSNLSGTSTEVTVISSGGFSIFF